MGKEAFGFARDQAYQLPTAGTDAQNNAVFLLSAAYQQAAADLAAKQLEKAGCRLAMILNAASL